MQAQSGGIEGSDAGGRNDSVAMVGNQTVVESRLQAARRPKASRVGGAVQAKLGKTVDKATLGADKEAAMQRGSLIQVSVEHVAAAERKLDQYLLLFPLPNGAAYPSAEMMVEFGSWCSRVRERRCLAHRVDSERGGLGKGTVQKYLSEMFNHIWSCKWPEFGKLPYGEQCTYKQAVFHGYDGIYANEILQPRRS